MMSEENPEENSITEIRAFFASDPEHPLKENEFAEFWKSLTEAEKNEFRHADLTRE